MSYHECYAMINWDIALMILYLIKNLLMLCFLMKFNSWILKKLKNVEIILNNGIDVVCAGLDQDLEVSHGTLPQCCLGYQIKIIKIYMDFACVV